MDGSSEVKRPPTPAEAAGELLRREQQQDSLHYFLRGAWSEFEGGRPFTDGWAIGAVCEHVSAVIKGHIRDLVINIPPRMSKSSIVGVCTTPWAWIEQPSLQFFYSSYSDKLSIRDHVKARRLIESHWYKMRWGQSYDLTHDQNTKIRYDNTKGGYRVASSTDGTTTGEGGDILICDDPNSAKDISDAKLDTVLEWWTYVMPTRLNDMKTGRRIIVQQRVHEKDVTGDILKNDVDNSWVKLILPMEFETMRRSITVKLPGADKPWQDPRQQEGELLWPERVGQKELKRLKKELKTAYAVAGQLQQRPSPGEGGIIKKKWFQRWDYPEPPHIEFSILSIDTAMSEDKEAAMSCATVWGVFEHPEFKYPCVILLNIWRGNVEYPELRERVIRLSNHYLDDGPIYNPDGTMTKPLKPRADRKPTMVLIEAKNNGISMIQEISRSEINVIRFNPDKLGDKTMRVRLVTPVLESKKVWMPGLPMLDKATGKFYYDRMRPWADAFVERCGNFPKGDSRDDVDTMTQALWRLHQSGWVHVSGDPVPEPVYTNPGGQDASPIY